MPCSGSFSLCSRFFILKPPPRSAPPDCVEGVLCTDKASVYNRYFLFRKQGRQSFFLPLQYLQGVGIEMPGVGLGIAEFVGFLTVVDDVKAGDCLAGAGCPVRCRIGQCERDVPICIGTDPAADICAGSFGGCSVSCLCLVWTAVYTEQSEAVYGAGFSFAVWILASLSGRLQDSSENPHTVFTGL